MAKAFKRRAAQIQITGVDFKETIDQACTEKAIDTGLIPSRIEDAVSEADLVMICTPINIIISLLPGISKAVKPGVIVTDVGSTKSKITSHADKLFSDTNHFIGGHPMTGNEGHSYESSDPLLFENA